MTPVTPMLRQYLSIKEQNPDAIVFFRMGDFYEMFFEDARTAARILGITLTARGTHMGKKVPMCGVPHHASRSYIGKLVRNGWKVAVCEQVADPKAGKGVVNREVVRVVTPGSVVDEGEGDITQNLYLAAVAGGDPERAAGEAKYGLAHVDLSTGEFRVTEVNSLDELTEELGRVDPAELLVVGDGDLTESGDLCACPLEVLERDAFEPRRAETILKEQLGVSSLAGFGCEDMRQGVIAAGALVHYLQETQKGKPEHIKELLSYRIGESMFLDQATCTHLELLKTMRRQSLQGSLFHILDKTMTPMGSRMLKKWIAYPIVDIDKIKGRLASVTWFVDDPGMREDIRAELREIYDLERLNGRIALGRANARDLLALKTSLLRLPHLKERLQDSTSLLIAEIASEMDSLEDVARWIEATIRDEPPVSVHEGGMIKEGCDGTLDDLIALSRDGKSWIASFAVSEQKRVGIPNLKVGFNKVYGYYIEVSRANVPRAPSDYIRKQTLVNGERYITEELKKMEEQVLGAEEKRVALEYELFDALRRKVARENQRIRLTAGLTATLDVLSALAETAQLNHYTCPQVHAGMEIEIFEGRHPVVEQTVKEEDFVPNDIQLDAEERQILIITGPNMAGKSTVLRQTALTVLMAQMGSFVPAAKAVVGIVDRIFTRVGASDDLARGRSTFMVEMNETANILRHTTPRSLVILDEIGRGTSTYDGLSIAWAVTEDLHDKDGEGVRTLFATHYHELTELVSTKQRVKNFNIAVREWDQKIIFLRKLVPGGTSRSYGIQVARLAGVPERVLERAKEILENLEGGELDGSGIPRLARSNRPDKHKHSAQMNLFGQLDNKLIDWIRGMDINSMSPLEALVELSRVKEYVESRK